MNLKRRAAMLAGKSAGGLTLPAVSRIEEITIGSNTAHLLSEVKTIFSGLGIPLAKTVIIAKDAPLRDRHFCYLGFNGTLNAARYQTDNGTTSGYKIQSISDSWDAFIPEGSVYYVLYFDDYFTA